MAALYAHVRATPSVGEKETLALLERGKPIREQLLATAEALVTFGLFDGALVQSIRTGLGNLDHAKDLITLGALFNANWESVSGKVPFDIALVQEASAIGANLVQAIGKTEVGDARPDPRYDWPELRARAFRLLVEAYEEIRRVVLFLRHHQGDAASFVPSLHTARKVTGPRFYEEVPTESELPEGNGGANDGALRPNAPLGITAGAPIGPGMPGESPFEE